VLLAKSNLFSHLLASVYWQQNYQETEEQKNSAALKNCRLLLKCRAWKVQLDGYFSSTFPSVFLLTRTSTEYIGHFPSMARNSPPFMYRFRVTLNQHPQNMFSQKYVYKHHTHSTVSLSTTNTRAFIFG